MFWNEKQICFAHWSFGYPAGLDPRQVQSKDDIENKGFVFSYHYQVHGFILKSNSTFFPNCGLQKNVHKDISILNRQCLRRRSARIRSEEIKPPSDVFETEDTKISTCFPSIEDDPPRENGSASASVPVHDEGTEHAPRHEAANKRLAFVHLNTCCILVSLWCFVFKIMMGIF